MAVFSVEMRLCSEVNALFVEVYSDDDSTELSVTATIREGKKEVVLDFSFFVDVLDDVLDFMVYDDGSWSVECLYGFEEKSWFPDVLRVSKSLVFEGGRLKFVNLN